MALSGEQERLYEAIRASWDADAPDYDRHPSHGLRSEAERRAWRRLFGQVFAPLQQGRPLRVLDIGTGTGEMAILLAELGHDVTGVDLSPGMLALARQKAGRLGLALTFLEGRADAVPLPDASLDAVFSRHLLWTLPHPRAALREWARLVRPGGMVTIADGWWHEPSPEMRLRRAVAAQLRRLFEREDGHWHSGYQAIREQLPLAGGVSPYSVRYLLDSAGLERIRVRDLATIRTLERRPLPWWKRIDLARYTWLASAYRPG